MGRQGYVNPSLGFLFHLNRILDSLNAECKLQVVLAIVLIARDCIARKTSESAIYFVLPRMLNGRINLPFPQFPIDNNDSLFFQLADRQKGFAIVALSILIRLLFIYIYIMSLRRLVGRKSLNSLIERTDQACY